MTLERGASETITRQEVEDFLYLEAALLDDWRLDEWTELFTEDCQYVIPATDLVDGDPSRNLVLLSDDRAQLLARVKRLSGRRAHREFPQSRTRRLITNVRIICQDGPEAEVRANFLVYRIRRDVSPFVGQYRYRLVRDGERFKIRYRRVELDLESLRPSGTISFLL